MPRTDVHVTGRALSYYLNNQPRQVHEQCYLTAVSYSNTRYSLLLHLFALDGTINDITRAIRVSLQSSNELLSRKYTLQGHSCLVLGL